MLEDDEKTIIISFIMACAGLFATIFVGSVFGAGPAFAFATIVSLVVAYIVWKRL